MKYCWTTLLVKDLEKSLQFYTEVVGLPIQNRFSSADGNEIVFLGEGETKIELIENKRATFRVGNSLSLGFAVDSLDKMISFVKERGIEIESGPFSPSDHISFFYVLDPDGLRVQFSESH